MTKFVIFVAVSGFLTCTFTRSPAGASQTIGGTFSSFGITPGVAPGAMLDSSMIVSLPEKTVASWNAPAVVTVSAFMISFRRAGHGRYSYCHPERMLLLIVPVAMLTVPCLCGTVPPSADAGFELLLLACRFEGHGVVAGLGHLQH